MPESAVAEFHTLDGNSFGILKTAPKHTGQVRADTLLQMREVAQGEPKLLNNLATNSGISAEYAMGSAVSHAEDKQVKADLTRIYVNSSLQEGHRSSAVDRLAYANAAKLNLPEFSEPTVAGWFQADVSENKLHDAWSISHKALTKGKQIFGRTDLKTRKKWIARENESFERYAEQVLKEPQTPGEFTKVDQLFMECQTRKDSFGSQNPSEIAMKIAEQKVRDDLKKENGESLARFNVRNSGLPDNYVTEVMKKVSKEEGRSLFMTRLKNLVNEKKSQILASFNKLDEHTKATLVFMSSFSLSVGLAAISKVPGMEPLVGVSAGVGIAAAGYEISDLYKMFKSIRLESRRLAM